MTQVPLSFERVTDRDVHGDLLLRLGVYRGRVDSYYLAIEDSARAGPTLNHRLARLLEQWVSRLRKLEPGQQTFLAYDFSDEYTGWLRVDGLAGGRASVQAGWCTSIQGWELAPSDFGAGPKPHEFQAVRNASIECALHDLIETVEAQAAAFLE